MPSSARRCAAFCVFRRVDLGIDPAFAVIPLDNSSALCYTITVLNGLIQLTQQRGDRLIQINYNDSRPIYEKVKESLRQLILSGALPAGEKLPSVREQAMSLSINPNTIQRAYRELEQEGYIFSVPGKGSFVAQGGGARAARRAELTEKLRALVDELAALGLTREEIALIIKEERHD